MPGDDRRRLVADHGYDGYGNELSVALAIDGATYTSRRSDTPTMQFASIVYRTGYDDAWLQRRRPPLS